MSLERPGLHNEQPLIILAGVPVMALTFGALWGVEGGQITAPAAWLADRYSLGAGCVAVTGVALLLSIWRVALYRFMSDDQRPGAGLAPPPRAPLSIHLAVLQNTLEQSTLALCAYLPFAALAPERLLPLLPAYAVLFLVGRAAFALGYPFGAPGRAFGFALTIMPIATLYVLMLLWLVAPQTRVA